MRDGRIVRAHALWSFCFDSDLIWLYAQQFSHARLNFLCVWNDFWLGQDQRGIHIAYFVPRKPHLLQRFLKKNDGVGAFPFGIGRRKVAANIPGRDRSEQGIGNGMEKNVAVGVASKAFRVGKLHPAYF